MILEEVPFFWVPNLRLALDLHASYMCATDKFGIAYMMYVYMKNLFSI